MLFVDYHMIQEADIFFSVVQSIFDGTGENFYFILNMLKLFLQSNLSMATKKS